MKTSMLVIAAALLAAAVAWGRGAALERSDRMRDSHEMQTDILPARTASAVSSRDKSFLEDAAKGGLFEVMLGKLAIERASSPAVRQFGERMVRDHSKANKELQALASERGITLPTKPGIGQTLSYKRLEMLHGRQFDRAYAKAMQKDHDADMKTFDKALNGADDPDVRAFASKTYITIHQHDQMAYGLSSSAAGGRSKQ